MESKTLFHITLPLQAHRSSVEKRMPGTGQENGSRIHLEQTDFAFSPAGRAASAPVTIGMTRHLSCGSDCPACPAPVLSPRPTDPLRGLGAGDDVQGQPGVGAGPAARHRRRPRLGGTRRHPAAAAGHLTLPVRPVEHATHAPAE